MSRKIKRLWKLYKELRYLRCKTKLLDSLLVKSNNEIKQRNEHIESLEGRLLHRALQSYDTLTIQVPNMYAVECIIGRRNVSGPPSTANQIQQRMTDDAKIKMFDDLCRKGYITKVQDDYRFGEMYEIKVVR